MKTNHLIVMTLSLSLLGAADAMGKIGVIVNRDLYPYIRQEVKTYINDLIAIEHKRVWVDTTSFRSTSSIATLRSTLQSRYRSDDLEGAVFIGDLPIANYELRNDFDLYGYAEFPIDLYFMDLDGAWLDTVKNGGWNGYARTGWFDGHAEGTGNKKAEIWVSRTIGSMVPALGSDIAVMREYLNRLHRRMTGNDPLPRKMLICGNDVQWREVTYWAGASILGYAGADVTTYLRSTPGALDSKENWIAGLRAGQEYAGIYEHSSATLHNVVNNFTNQDYLNLPGTGGASNVRFYHLYACSNARYTVPNFLGGLYAWGQNGLLSLGSTKTGGMIGYEYFNPRLGEGCSFGDAFKTWLNYFCLFPSNQYAVFWCYGMAICGAGNLKLQKYPPPMQTIAINGSGYEWMYFGSVKVPPQGVQICVTNPDYRFGAMFTVRNTSSSCTVDLQWHGVEDQNMDDCQDRTVGLIGNGAQKNNVCTPRCDDGKMYFILRSRNSSTHTEAIEIFNWRNGTGCW